MLRLENIRQHELTAEYLEYTRAAIKDGNGSATKPKRVARLPPGVDPQMIKSAVKTANVAYEAMQWDDYLQVTSSLQDIDANDANYEYRAEVAKAMSASAEAEIKQQFDALLKISLKLPQKADIWLGLAFLKMQSYQFNDALAFLDLAAVGTQINHACAISLREKVEFCNHYCTIA